MQENGGEGWLFRRRRSDGDSGRDSRDIRTGPLWPRLENMADEPEKIRRSTVGERLKAMFKAAEELPVPGKLRDVAAERADEEAAPKRRRKR